LVGSQLLPRMLDWQPSHLTHKELHNQQVPQDLGLYLGFGGFRILLAMNMRKECDQRMSLKEGHFNVCKCTLIAEALMSKM
jgi:hypothetical protein